MTAKYYCDGCGGEMAPTEHARLRLRLGRISVEVLHAVDKTWNGGHACHTCLKKVVADGEKADESTNYVRGTV